MRHTTSLTEWALTNATALDYFLPSKYEKISVTPPQVSTFYPVRALHCLEVVYDQIGTKAPINVNRRWEPVRAVGRVLYVSFVVCFVSPSGVLGYGALAVYSSARSAFLACLGRPNEARSTWEKTKNYASACFSDVVSLGVAASSVAMAVGGVRLILQEWQRFPSIANRLAVVTMFGSLVLLMCAPFGLFSYRIGVECLLLNSHDNNEKRDLAFSLRQNFGIVNQKGGLLTCSNEDLIKTRVISRERNTLKIEFIGWAEEQLRNLAFRADADFFNKVIEVKRYLEEQGKESLPYSYPFNLETVVSHLRGQWGEEKPEKVEELVAELEALKRKARMLEELHRSRLQRKQTNKREKTACYLDEGFYHECFQKNLRTIVLFDSMKDLAEELLRTNRGALIPNNPETETTYQRFKDLVIYSRWLAEAGGMPLSHRQMLGLSESCSEEDFKSKANEYSMAVHPDKNSQSEESNALFKLLRFIQEALREDFRKKASGEKEEEVFEDEFETDSEDFSPEYLAFIAEVISLELGDMEMVSLEELRKRSFYDQFKAFAIYLKRAQIEGSKDFYGIEEILPIDFENFSFEEYQDTIGKWEKALSPENYPDKIDEARQLFKLFLLAKAGLDEDFEEFREPSSPVIEHLPESFGDSESDDIEDEVSVSGAKEFGDVD